MNEEIWDEDRVIKMIADGIEESLHLDYKAAGALAKLDKKREEIVKDVTAFANSDGGIIIYGVREHSTNDKKHLPERLDSISRAEFSKEWLEHVIASAAPRIPNIRIHPIPISTDDTKCLYVVEIPKGGTAHQATDGRYYRRYNFESVFMRDHEIRDVMNRSKHPRIEVEGFLRVRSHKREGGFRLKLSNVGNRLAKHYVCIVKMPTNINGALNTPNDGNFTLEHDERGEYFQFSLGQSLQQTPLFPKSSLIMEKEFLPDASLVRVYPGVRKDPREFIAVKVYADEMEPLHLEFDPKLIQGVWGPPL
jgi:hypothetical protein